MITVIKSPNTVGKWRVEFVEECGDTYYGGGRPELIAYGDTHAEVLAWTKRHVKEFLVRGPFMQIKVRKQTVWRSVISNIFVSRNDVAHEPEEQRTIKKWRRKDWDKITTAVMDDGSTTTTSHIRICFDKQCE